MQKNVCHITSVHKWNDVRIFEKECQSLVAAGYNVTLLAVNCAEVLVNGVNVKSVNVNYSGRLSRFTKVVKAVLNKAIEIDADLYHIHDPELLRIALKLTAKGKKVIYDSHEDLPKQIYEKHWIPFFLRSLVSKYTERYEKKITSKIAGVVTATTIIRDRFLKYNKNVVEVCNYPKLDLIQIRPDWKNKTNEVCYLGGIFTSRGAIEIVKAIGKTNYRLNLAGNYSPESLRSELMSLKGWEHCNEYGFVNRDQVVEILSKSKIGLVTLHPTKSYIEALPIKMFEYMAAGIPVIASDFKLWREIVEKNNCGILVNPLNPDEIAVAINKLMNDDELARIMGENGRKAVLNYYAWDNEAKKLIDLYSKILNEK